MDVQIGMWGLYPWFPEHGLDLIHPDDSDKIKDVIVYGKLFECVGNDGEFISLACHDQSNCFSIRARPTLFQPVPKPPVQVGDAVTVLSKGILKTAEISRIGWHLKNNQHIFILKIDGKLASKRYWHSEFVRS